MQHLTVAATVFLGLFAVVAGIDGIYFHLWKYRLYARAESFYEHTLHTIRAFLFIPIVFFFFARNFGGWLLWAGVLFLVIDLVVEMMDVLCENRSREKIGGLSSAEYAAHVAATTLRIAAIALILAAKPPAAWKLSAPVAVDLDYPLLVSATALNIITGNILVGGLHVWLMQKKYRVVGEPLQIRGCGGI